MITTKSPIREIEQFLDENIDGDTGDLINIGGHQFRLSDKLGWQHLGDWYLRPGPDGWFTEPYFRRKT